MTTIFVYLLDEGTDAWRPVNAEEVSSGKFRIVSRNEAPDDECWQFNVGEVVRCEAKHLSEGECLVAVAGVPDTSECEEAWSALETALADYVDELCKSADQTHRAEDRPRYQTHLAEAARMFRAVRQTRSLAELRSIVARERHNYGWSFLSNEEGRRAEAAFEAFATRVEQQRPAV